MNEPEPIDPAKAEELRNKLSATRRVLLLADTGSVEAMAAIQRSLAPLADLLAEASTILGHPSIAPPRRQSALADVSQCSVVK